MGKTHPLWATSPGLWVLALSACMWIGPGCGDSYDPYPLEDGGELGDMGAPVFADSGQVRFKGNAAGSEPAANHCLAGITDYSKPGPFTYKRIYGLVNMWVPNVPKGCKVPMVHLANGTGAICAVYEPSLRRLASHGFLALCFQSPVTGAGVGAIVAFETALKRYPDLADYKFGSTGHSQGGMGALVALQRAEEKWGSKGTYAGLAMQPASGFGAQPLLPPWPLVYAKIKSPVFMFSGLGTDGLVPQPWVTAAYLALSNKIEAYHWLKVLSLHIPVPNAEEMEISIPWFRWKLLGDRKACEYFKAIPKKNLTWIVKAQQNVPSCD